MVLQRLEIPSPRDGWVLRYDRTKLGKGALHAHRELELNLVVSGSGQYLINGGRYSIGPGSLLWLFPSQPHLLVEACDSFVMWVVVFRPRLVKRVAADPCALKDLLRRPELQQVYAVRLNGLESADLSKGFDQLDQLPSFDHAWFNAGLGYLLRLAWERTIASQPLQAASRVHPSVEKALHLLKDRPDAFSFKSLAQAVGMSYSRLSVLFAQQTGERLSDYRNRMRVDLFLRLISQFPDRTLLDLALASGFGSYAQCHRVVSHSLHRSPRQLRAALPS